MDQSHPPTPPKPAQAAPTPKPMQAPGRMRYKKRHKGLATGFVVLVLLPLAAIAAYLYLVATDQYASRVGFSVRSQEMPSSESDLLGGLMALSSGSSKDSDVLYEFIGSQQIVDLINADLDLVAIFSKPENDPFFAYDPNGTIEDLVDYWGRMVKTD